MFFTLREFFHKLREFFILRHSNGHNMCVYVCVWWCVVGEGGRGCGGGWGLGGGGVYVYVCACALHLFRHI